MVNGMTHMSGLESFRALFKRAYHDTYHKRSRRHLQCYAHPFAGRQSMRDLDTLEQMRHIAAGWVGKRLVYRNGWRNGLNGSSDSPSDGAGRTLLHGDNCEMMRDMQRSAPSSTGLQEESQ